MRVIFAGTPTPAIASLEALAASGHEVVAVLTRPEAPRGRGRSLHPSEVAVAAERLGLPVHEGKVQVVITLAGEDAAFLAEFDAEVGSQSGDQVQVYVPPANLCALGADERVEAVRAPDLAASW